MKAIRSVKYLIVLGLASFLFAFISCDDEENPSLLANEYLVEFMDYWYLWYNQMPEVDPEDYASPVELLEALRYKELDKWSYITTKQELESYYEEGTYVGYGFGSVFDQEYTLWITFVFRNSPLVELGVDRGWKILAINSTVPTPQNLNELLGPASAGTERVFTFEGPNGETITRPVEKNLLTMNTVLMDSIYTFGSTKVGYFVLKGFIGPTINELDQVFSDFLSQGVTELIVDLRYNGGGSLPVSAHLAGQIAGNIANGQVYGNVIHNDKRQDENFSYFISAKSNSLNLSRVVFITTGSSASASEVLINGLKPYIDVTLVGSKTYGKPVGMYGKTFAEFDWAFVPICFRVLNANNQGDFYSGIPVDYPYADGVAFPFGDLNEYSLSGAVSYLTGSMAKRQPVSAEVSLKYIDMKGLQGEIGAW